MKKEVFCIAFIYFASITIVAGQPSVRSSNTGNYIFVWDDNREGNSDIYFQQFLESGERVFRNVKVNNDSGKTRQHSSSMAVDGNGNFIITWIDERNGRPEVFAQRFLAERTRLNTNFRVDDDSIKTIRSSSYYKIEPANPSIAADSLGNFIIVWENRRIYEKRGIYEEYKSIEDSDIYAQSFSSKGEKVGRNFKVNDDNDNRVEQKSPSICANSKGIFVFAWEDERGEGENIYAQILRNDGTSIGTNFKVNKKSSYSSEYKAPCTSIHESGNFMIVWTGGIFDKEKIYGQYYSPEGNQIGKNFKVSNLKKYYYNFEGHPIVEFDDNGEFVVVWVDESKEKPTTFAQRYSKNKKKIGKKTIFNLHVEEIALSQNGNFLVVWEQSSDIYAQHFSKMGTSVNSHFIVNDKIIDIPEIAGKKGDEPELITALFDTVEIILQYTVSELELEKLNRAISILQHIALVDSTNSKASDLLGRCNFLLGVHLFKIRSFESMEDAFRKSLAVTNEYNSQIQQYRQTIAKATKANIISYAKMDSVQTALLLYDIFSKKSPPRDPTIKSLIDYYIPKILKHLSSLSEEPPEKSDCFDLAIDLIWSLRHKDVWTTSSEYWSTGETVKKFYSPSEEVLFMKVGDQLVIPVAYRRLSGRGSVSFELKISCDDNLCSCSN